MEEGVYIEESLRDVLQKTDLLNFERKLCINLQLSRLEHFDHITDDELTAFTGMSQPAVRRLRQAILEKRKKSKKSKGIFGTLGKKEGREVTKVLLPAAVPSLAPNALQNQFIASLIGKEEIKLMEKLGEGSFAVVKRAIWESKEGQKLDVAAKILRNSTSEIFDDLQQEVYNMQKLRHPNLILLHGIVFANPAIMIVEFCDGGSLVDRLRTAEKPVILVSTLVDYAQQIAKGMAYLESKRCVHRDLAARNVLLTDNERVAKICDFGLMRVLDNDERLYVMSTHKKVPFAWCPPESLKYRRFSHASDVWAFGVTIWELFSYGEEPWIGLRGAEVLTRLEAGERLQRPQRCSNELFDLIQTCWSLMPESRPKFSLLKSILSEIRLMVAECREVKQPSGEVDLELAINDHVVVIHGEGTIWYGQNVRTRLFGSFQRSSVYLRSGRSDGNDSPIKVINGITSKVSKPIPGSFIHAGHGDIDPKRCWGQPEKIDDIYLKNPILRKKEDYANDLARRRYGPEIIASLTEMQPPAFQFGDGNSTKNSPSVDPYAVDSFASFSDYSYDIMVEKPRSSPTLPQGRGTGLHSQEAVDKPVYDQPSTMLTDSYKVVAFPQTSSTTTLHQGMNQGPSLKELPRPSSTSIRSSEQNYASLPRPSRTSIEASSSKSDHLSSSITGVSEEVDNQRPRMGRQCLSASNLPPSSANKDDIAVNIPVSQAQKTSMNRAGSYLAATAGDILEALDNHKAKNGRQIPPRLPATPPVSNTPRISTDVPTTSTAKQSFASETPAVSVPVTSQQTVVLSQWKENPDPFEVPSVIKNLTNRDRYSQLYAYSQLERDIPASTSYTTQSQNTATFSVNKTDPSLLRPAALALNNCHAAHQPQALATSLGFSENRVPPFYWQPRQTTAFGITQRASPATSFGSTPVYIYDAQLGKSGHHSAMSSAVSFRPRSNFGSDKGSSATGYRNSVMNDEILGMFDPLISDRNTTPLQNCTARVNGSGTNTSNLGLVIKNAAFANPERCAAMLQRCANDVEKTIRELKTDELLSMGLARDRSQAISALEDCRWDLNAAAAALIA